MLKTCSSVHAILFFLLFVRQFTVLPVTLVLDVLEFVAFLILNLF